MKARQKYDFYKKFSDNNLYVTNLQKISKKMYV